MIRFLKFLLQTTLMTIKNKSRNCHVQSRQHANTATSSRRIYYHGTLCCQDAVIKELPIEYEIMGDPAKNVELTV